MNGFALRVASRAMFGLKAPPVGIPVLSKQAADRIIADDDLKRARARRRSKDPPAHECPGDAHTPTSYNPGPDLSSARAQTEELKRDLGDLAIIRLRELAITSKEAQALLVQYGIEGEDPAIPGTLLPLSSEFRATLRKKLATLGKRAPTDLLAALDLRRLERDLYGWWS